VTVVTGPAAAGLAGARPVTGAPATGVSPAQGRLAEVLAVFSSALREIDVECARRGQGPAYRTGIGGFLGDTQNPYHRLFSGVALVGDGEVEPAAVMANATAVGGPDPQRVLFDGMNELTFFALFQAAELLDPQVDEDLARRVRNILATLQR
jgi:hypothetical protein